ILIQGGAGGVASVAIQLARHLGARVITTAGTNHLGFVRELGADEGVNHETTDFTPTVQNCDAGFDTVGGRVAMQSYPVLNPGGRAAFIASGAHAPKPERDDVTGLRPEVRRDRTHLERIAALYQAGAIRPPPVTLFDLANAAEALRIIGTHHASGKLVLKVR